MLACVLLLLAGQHEASPEQHLDRARACLNALDYACAERAFAGVRPHLDLLAPDLAKDALHVGAEVALSQERWADAEDLLRELLEREPTFDPRWPPRWRQALDAARSRVTDRAPPVIEHAEASGVPLTVRARIRDRDGVGRATVRFSGLEVAMTSTDGVSFTAIVPAGHPALTIEAFDVRGNGPARKELTVAAQAPEAAAEEERANVAPWWVWTLAGVALAGAAIGVGLGAAAGDDSGTVTARISWPSR